MVIQLCRMAFVNKNIATEGWTFAPFISVSSVGSPFFISLLGFEYSELQMDKLLPKSECRFYLDGMALNCFCGKISCWYTVKTQHVGLPYIWVIMRVYSMISSVK